MFAAMSLAAVFTAIAAPDPGASGTTTAAAPADTEVEVTFDGDEEVAFDAQVVAIDSVEEIDRASLEDLPPLPEYRYSRWLLGLPALCALVLVWNVDWRTPGRLPPGERKKRKRV